MLHCRPKKKYKIITFSKVILKAALINIPMLKTDKITTCNVKVVTQRQTYRQFSTLQFISAPKSIQSLIAHCFGFLTRNLPVFVCLPAPINLPTVPTVH